MGCRSVNVASHHEDRSHRSEAFIPSLGTLYARRAIVQDDGVHPCLDAFIGDFALCVQLNQMERPIVFLDIDGVLNRREGLATVNPQELIRAFD
jgi:hypothetical protein